MLLQAQKNSEKILRDKEAIQLINKLKSIVYGYDKNAEIILFGSRARVDWHEESDWDFLILTAVEATEEFKSNLRNKILDEIEIPLDEGVFVIVKNKVDWEENYNVMPLFYNISEEGIKL